MTSAAESFTFRECCEGLNSRAIFAETEGVPSLGRGGVAHFAEPIQVVRDLRLARHEASHAVVACALGVPLVEVRIDPPAQAICAAPMESTKARVAFALAGPVADALFEGANPARDVPYFDSENEDGIHAWTLEEVQKYEGRWPIGSKARLALALLLYTAQRRSDVVKFGQKDIHDGWLRFTQFKGRKRKPVTMELPVVRPLREIIDATPGVGIKTFLVTDFGKPFSDAGFGNKFRTWCDAAGLPQCSAHGVRKATSAKLAELGCSDREIMSVTGHRTTKEVTRYTRSARQKILASRAMKKLDRASK